MNLLAFGVESAGRLVEKKDFRIANDRPGNRDSLLLTPGQLSALFANWRAITLNQDERP
jgi:hypothetical protein